MDKKPVYSVDELWNTVSIIDISKNRLNTVVIWWDANRDILNMRSELVNFMRKYIRSQAFQGVPIEVLPWKYPLHILIKSKYHTLNVLFHSTWEMQHRDPLRKKDFYHPKQFFLTLKINNKHLFVEFHSVDDMSLYCGEFLKIIELLRTPSVFGYKDVKLHYIGNSGYIEWIRENWQKRLLPFFEWLDSDKKTIAFKYLYFLLNNLEIDRDIIDFFSQEDWSPINYIEI